MELYYSFSVLIVVASFFAYLNYRFLKLPATIGIMVIAMIVSLVMATLGDRFFPKTFFKFFNLVNQFDFTEVLMGAMLNFLLFAGGIHVNINNLKAEKGPIMIFSTVSVIISAFVVAYIVYYVFPLIGLHIPFIYCLLFGALISPTDPVAVLSILKQANVSKSLETKVAGESLFNDGMSVVMFAVILQLAQGAEIDLTFKNICWLLLKEAGGGLLLGVLLGWGASRAMRRVDDYKISVLTTLSVVMGGYLIAHAMHISGPLTMVAAGLFMGNFNVRFTMKSETRDYLNKFWELIDEILNSILFLYIGLQLLLMPNLWHYWAPGIICIFVVLFARLISIWIPTKIIPFKEKFGPQTVKVLVWGGIRGGVSIALALSLPDGPCQGIIIAITYVVVIFSIIVQGLTIGKLAKKMEVE
ncbi:cation:proton antiporter [Rhizosphaericola mali]|uniref:Sodium:proton antiporter n=1 Tax=Rhizosphaericola mali TaxID=2545455 RepID=A0A5P2G1P8_9BACT|nr:sodium:proton antiporter [Rhizosphaericola mali]QES87762.1 sodium:proton antiporter [Rhizosphaericola mali]